MEIESKDEQSIKREWKEVQLKISETGVMSVTDISNLDTKKSTKVNEINQQSGLEQASSNNYNVNKIVVKTEDKEPLKSCSALSKTKKTHQENINKKSEQKLEEKPSALSLSAISVPPSNSKSEEMELKSIDQHDLSNELLKTGSEKSESNLSKVTSESSQTSSVGDKSQAQNVKQQLQEKVKVESTNPPDKRPDTKHHPTVNNFVNSETKVDLIGKHSTKSCDLKASPSAGSKINALSAKLQFQPKVGQVNNTYSKKTMSTDKKATPSALSLKLGEAKTPKPNPRLEAKVTSDVVSASASSDSRPTSVSAMASSALGNTAGPHFQRSLLISPATMAPAIPNESSGHQRQQQTPSAPTSESLASIGLHVSTTLPSQPILSGWMSERGVALGNAKGATGKGPSPEQQLRGLPGMPQIGKDIVCSTTSGASPATSLGRFNIQTPSMSIYSITTSAKNNAYTSATHGYGSPSKQSGTKSGLEVTSMYPVPPCPDAIPISLMKPASGRKGLEAVPKGTALNEICAKISGAGAGSKINDICAKIGESSKEKSKIEAQRGKPELPDLLKISKKGPTPTNEIPSPVKHLSSKSNIPNVPIYTPSNSQSLQPSPDSKDPSKRLGPPPLGTSQASIMSAQLQKVSAQKKHSQPVGYKTLRDPPKSWNPTLSKNNYVAAKNQAKEIQNQSQAAYGLAADGSSISKQIPSKPAKIFKIRNMPRYLGKPNSKSDNSLLAPCSRPSPSHVCPLLPFCHGIDTLTHTYTHTHVYR
jgi:hypothetical protein